MEISCPEHNKEQQEVDNNFIQPGSGPEPPHEAMFLVLAYLPLFELLSMGQVCKPIKQALDNDILPWLNLLVENPLNSRVSDNILMEITSKANGRLKTLGLIDCVKITDDGLQAVIANNPLINKLYIPGCTCLTPEGVIKAVEILSDHSHRPICLKINGIYNINKEHLEMLRSLIQVNQTHRKQLCNFYHNKHKHYSTFRQEHEINPAIDVDICPKCSEVRMVFDCPQQTCMRNREKQLTECRGCHLCIPRCEVCGKCVDAEGQDDSEAACADILCTECWLQLPKCNFCNKPYCNQHAQRQCSLPGLSGFVCDVCHSKFMETSNN